MDHEAKTINVVVPTPPESLDTRYAVSAVSVRLSQLLFAPLFILGEDARPTPFLAESISALDDKTFKIKLKDKLTFHDGSILSADDVVYTFLTLDSADVASPHEQKFDYVRSIKALNNHELLFELHEAHAPFLTDLCAIGIVSKKSCENRSQQCRHELNGSGPYKLKKWDKAKEAMFFEPFASWFEGKPPNHLRVRVVRDENTRMLELIGKKTDIIDSDLSPTNMTELKKYAHLDIAEIPGLGYSYIAFNLRGPRPEDKPGTPEYITRMALADKRVRRAMARSINFDQIIEKILLNTAHRTSGLIPNTHWAKGSTLKPLPYDPELAMKELDEAGFKAQGPDKMRFKLVVSSSTDRMRQNIAQLNVDFLRRVGIDATLRVKDWSALYEDMTKGNFEVFSANWVPVTDPDLYYWVHHSSSIPTDGVGGANRHAYINPQADKLFDEGRRTMDPEKRKKIYEQAESLLQEDMPYISLWNENRIIILNNERVSGYIPSATGSLMGVRKAYIKDSQSLRAAH
jgi:peptide/nickel transport system substrate-binding protein